jgi:cytochrome c553
MILNKRAWRGVRGAIILASLQGMHSPIAQAATARPAAPTAVVACQACHGGKGEGMATGGIPWIAGQSADYLDKQLKDFASGSRESAIMSPIARTLSNADRVQVVAYFAALPKPNGAGTPLPADPPGDPAAVARTARGHQLAVEGSEAHSVQACDNCHGPEGSGVPFAGPTLAGQLAPYLAAQLKSWQQGTRRNDNGNLMSSVAARLSDPDIAAVTSYYGSLASSSSGTK